MTVKAGTLSHRVSLESPIYGRNNDGQKIITGWTNEFDRWANIQPLRVIEQLQAMSIETKAQYKITLRLCPDFKSNLRIVEGHTVYNIVGYTQTSETTDILATVYED